MLPSSEVMRCDVMPSDAMGGEASFDRALPKPKSYGMSRSPGWYLNLEPCLCRHPTSVTLAVRSSPHKRGSTVCGQSVGSRMAIRVHLMEEWCGDGTIPSGQKRLGVHVRRMQAYCKPAGAQRRPGGPKFQGGRLKILLCCSLQCKVASSVVALVPRCSGEVGMELKSAGCHGQTGCIGQIGELSHLNRTHVLY
jgi:hypothetical protein